MRRAPAAAGALCILLAFAPAAALAQVADWPSERPPRPLPARDVRFPPYQVKTLANGLQVIAVSHHEQPAVSLRLILSTGGYQDPPDKPGVASLAAALLDQGTNTRTAEAIASTIDSIGGAIGTGAGADLTFIQAVVMKDSLGLALDLVSDVAMNPAFAPEEIDRQKQQVLSGLKVSFEDPDFIAGVVFDRLVYGFHPYGRVASGTPESIASITRNDLLAYHGAWFGANNAILAIVGDVTAEEAFAGAERAFGKWARATQSSSVKVTPPPEPTRRVIVIDRPGAVQTEIRAGNIGLPRKHPDYLALDLALKILGGEGGNRLHRVLRSERGLTYGASADVHALKDTGDIMADTDTRSESTGEVLRLLVDEMWRLQRQRVHPRELADAQAYLTGSFPLTIETPSAIALQILNAVFYGLDLTELQTYRERVNAVTPEDIQRVAQQYLRPDRLSIVLVGDASVFSKGLAAVGFDRYDVIPLSQLDLTAPDLRRGRMPSDRLRLEPAASPANGPPPGQSAQELVGQAVQAKGGLEKLRSVRSVTARSTTLVDATGGRAELPTTTYIRYPDAFRVDVETPRGTVMQLYAEGRYWVRDERGAREAPAAIASDMRGSIDRDAIRLLLRLAENPSGLRRTSARLDGRDLPAILVPSPGGRPVTVILDPDTGLVVGQRYLIESPGGPVEAEERFSDYRDVDGLKVAFRAVLQRAGAPRVERILRDFAYNVSLDPALFAAPL